MNSPPGGTAVRPRLALDRSLSQATYVLPLRRTEAPADAEMLAYLGWIAQQMPVIVVDGSPPTVFAAHHAALPPDILHLGVDPAFAGLNGKVAGVRTAMQRTTSAIAVIADDDVRYDEVGLRGCIAALDSADVVLPQNFFGPLPWHARLDTARILLNRASGGDWPGTIVMRRRAYERAGGYSADVLFENLELVRTLRAAGAVVRRLDGAYVRRTPPPVEHFWGQRVRQAYDEFARPLRLLLQLAIVPAISFAGRAFGARAICAACLTAVAVAETGRRRDGGIAVFPACTVFFAPLWLLERGITSWCAVFLRFGRGGVRYSNGRIRTAANSDAALRRRYAAATHVPRAGQ